MIKLILFAIIIFSAVPSARCQDSVNRRSLAPDSIATHKVLLDKEGKLLSWIQPQEKAYDSMLRLRWNFILQGIPPGPGPAPRSDYPFYYFYCAYRDQKMIPDTWMNDVGEKIPNWFESARLYYQYTGDERPLQLVIRMAGYAIDHGTSPKDFSWPGFPYTTTNAGDTIFRGFTEGRRFVLHEIQVDHAADMGLAYYGLYIFTRDKKFLKAALSIANVLSAKARPGTLHRSVWPYRVVMSDGRITAEYGANWFPAYELLRQLADAGLGNVTAYRSVMKMVKNFILQFPMNTGYWADGHTDTDVSSDTYKSNMSASNATLYLLQHQEFDPDRKKHIPMLIRWTEDNFVTRSAPGEPSVQWGANLVGEQDDFLPKMEYQTARYAAACAAWSVLGKDSSYRRKAYRALNWVTYCTDRSGMVFESPVSKGINSWWSDCYGEGPRMLYLAMAAIPQWVPAGENHILYSEQPLRSVRYGEGKLTYMATGKHGIEYIRLRFKPSQLLLNQQLLTKGSENQDGFILTALGEHDFLLIIRRPDSGTVSITR